MDIDKALAELRAAFKRVKWSIHEDAIYGGGAVVRQDGLGTLAFSCHMVGDMMGTSDGCGPDPVSAVRAWLAAQPTAAFYPEPSPAALTECRGTLVMYAAGAWGMAGFSDTGDGDTARRHAFLLAEADPKAAGAWAEYPVVVRVPVPVDPPVLVGEVEP